MNFNQRRPTGTHLNFLEPVNTKSDYTDILKEEGVETREERTINNGSRCRRYYASKDGEEILVEVAYTGDKPNWQNMLAYALASFKIESPYK